MTERKGNGESKTGGEGIRFIFLPLAAHAAGPCEENTDYWVNLADANDGYNDRLPNLNSCTWHCKYNYPNAPYFTWISPASGWTDGHNACYCKVGIGTRKVVAGLTSGEVGCTDTTPTGTTPTEPTGSTPTVTTPSVPTVTTPSVPTGTIQTGMTGSEIGRNGRKE